MSFYVLLLSPFILFSKPQTNEKEVYIPKKIGTLFIAFLSFTFLSVLMSANIQKSFEFLLLYSSCILIFIYCYNFNEKIKTNLIPLIFCFAIFFSFYSQLVLLVPGLIPRDPFHQFVFSSFGHNHLGDFLILPIVILIFYSLKNGFNIRNILLILLLFPFFLFSFARSAYIDLIIIICIIIWSFREKIFKSGYVRTVIPGALILCILAFFTLIPSSINLPQLLKAREFLSENFNLKYKTFTGGRENYVYQGVSGIFEKPLTGIGPGNFYVISEKFSKTDTVSENAHNLFIDIFSENGIPSGIIFVLITLLLFYGAKKNIFALLALAIFLNFQTDYTYRILSYFLLFFVILGTVYEEKAKMKAGKSIKIASIIIFVCALLVFTSSILHANGSSKIALIFYPLNELAYVSLISSSEDKLVQEKYISIYTNLVSDKESSLFIAGIYEKRNEPKSALKYYEEALEFSGLRDMNLVEKIYLLKESFEGAKSSEKFINSVFIRAQDDDLTPRIKRGLTILCSKVYNSNCPHNFK